MGTFPRVTQIRRVPALSLIGNLQATEGRAEDVSPSEARTLLGLATTSDVVLGSLQLSGDLLFNATNTYDIGNGTYDPRTVRAATSVLTPLLNNSNASGLILGNSTHGVIVPGEIQGQKGLSVYGGGSSGNAGIRLGSMFSGYGGIWDYAVTPSTTNYAIATDANNTYINCTAGIYFRAANSDIASISSTGAATFFGDISMSKTSAQGYIRAYETAGVKNVAISHNGSNGAFTTSSGSNTFFSGTGQHYFFDSTGSKYLLFTQSGNAASITSIASAASYLQIVTESGQVNVASNGVANSTFNVLSGTGGRYTTLTHDGTNGILSTSSGNLNLVPTGGTVAVTAGITASGDISMSKTSAQGYIRSYATDAVKNVAMYHNGTDGYVVSSAASLVLDAVNNISISKPVFHYGNVQIQAGVGSNFIIGNQAGGYPYLQLTATNGGFLQAGVDKDATLSNQLYMVLSGSNNLSLRSGTGHVMLNPGNSLIPIMGATSSYPAIKRSSTTAAFRLGDDSADAPISCAGITASGNVSYAQGLSTGTVTKSANYTTTADDYCVNVTANSIDITFETAVGCANREHEVINSGSGTVTLKTTSAQTISGSASGALTLAQWKSIRVKSDGANWLIMSQIT